MNKKVKYIRKTSLHIQNWPDVANTVLFTNGICSTLVAQSNNLLQKIIVKYNKDNYET